MSDMTICATKNGVPYRVFCFWTGSNAITENRRKGLSSILEHAGVPVILVTPRSLDRWILPDFPLHPAYGFLSEVHRSDYLRTYFMHHHGGGYADVKTQTASWLPSFDRLAADETAFGIGYQEVSNGVAPVDDTALRAEMERNYRQLIGNCCYIFRPRTAFTQEWIDGMHALMDRKMIQF